MNQTSINNKAEGAWTKPEPGRLALPDGEIHLWNMCPSHAYAKDLRPHERERYQRITNEEVKISFVTAQVGLREVAARYCGRSPDEVLFQRGPHGKPHLPGGPEFNLSHTAGRVFSAFSARPVGLDVESADRSVHAESLAEKFFSRAERERLLAVPEDERNRMFLRFWVCKEATVKLSGDGIFLGLRDVRVEWDERGGVRGWYRGRRVWLREFSPGGNLLACVATWHPVEVKCFFRI